MKNFSKNELKLLSSLLKMASEEFGRHGCNDLDLSEFMSKEEAIELRLDIEKDNLNGREPSSEDKEYIEKHPFHAMDFCLFTHFAHKIDKI